MTHPAVQLLVTVDTEEDGWWPTRVDVTARNVRELPRLQSVLERHAARLTCLTTYRVARDEEAVRTLCELRDRSGAEIGAHLHPWNTPPQDRPVADSVSLAGLPASTQRAMVGTLTEALTGATGSRPRSFRAGRRSLSPELVGVLAGHGYRVDSSVVPYMHWYDVPGSPAFFRAPPRPYRLGRKGDVQTPGGGDELVEVPATAGYDRAPWPTVARLDRLMRSRWLRPLHLHGILHRAGLLRRLTLNPEQCDAASMLALARAAVAQDLPVLNLYLHSSSLLPGVNEYVRSARDRDVLLDRIERFLDGVGELTDWRPTTLSEVGARFRGTEGLDGDR